MTSQNEYRICKQQAQYHVDTGLVVLIIHWFNPVLWYAYHRMQEDQEIASRVLGLSCHWLTFLVLLRK